MEPKQETVPEGGEPEGGGPSKRQNPKIEEGTHLAPDQTRTPPCPQASVAGVGEARRGARGPPGGLHCTHPA